MAERIAVDPVLLMYAFRYALGRHSYAVGDVARALIEHRDSLRLDWRQQIIRDIGEAIEDGSAANEAHLWGAVGEAMATVPSDALKPRTDIPDGETKARVTDDFPL